MLFLEFEKSIQKNKVSMRELHAHPYYEIYFLQSGERSFLLRNEIHTMSAPSLFIVPPHEMHMTQGGEFVRYNIYIMP
jgi:oxalate decarboxylase/phosphoglucose isomerase-like protein (cupin superfamily)